MPIRLAGLLSVSMPCFFPRLRTPDATRRGLGTTHARRTTRMHAQKLVFVIASVWALLATAEDEGDKACVGHRAQRLSADWRRRDSWAIRRWRAMLRLPRGRVEED
jgi:hypothetical protein